MIGKDFSHHQTRFCLNVIMKNEESVLERLFDSVADEIAGWFICDTGSTDGSVELTKSYFRRRGIPGKLKHHPWKDFAFNRNICMNDGRAEMTRLCDYWLILDADQELVNETPHRLWEYSFDADGYVLNEESHGVKFPKVRVVKVGDAWEYRGAVHESIYPKDRRGATARVGAAPQGFRTIHDTVVTRSAEEDVRILLQELEKMPNDTRTHFYLAKTYLGMPGGSAKSLYHYAKRIELGRDARNNNIEEHFMSLFHLASLLELLYLEGRLGEEHSEILRQSKIINGTMSSIDDIIEVYVMASSVLEYRYDPYAHIAGAYWKEKKDAHACYRYATKGLTVGSVKSETFLSTDFPLHALYNMMCTCGFHSSAFEGLVAACKYSLDRLPRKPSSPEAWETEFLKDSKFYLHELEKIGIVE